MRVEYEIHAEGTRYVPPEAQDHLRPMEEIKAEVVEELEKMLPNGDITVDVEVIE